MDQTLIDLLKLEPGAKTEVDKDIHVLNGRTGEIEFETPAGKKQHTLKPLGELYGDGHGAVTADPLEQAFMPLFTSIEYSILTFSDTDENLSDGLVILTLDRLGVNPACDPRDDELCRCIQFDLRLLLSLENYSKQEVRQACRTISKSAQRHSRTGGVRGYLEFLEKTL